MTKSDEMDNCIMRRMTKVGRGMTKSDEMDNCIMRKMSGQYVRRFISYRARDELRKRERVIKR
jgi:hypothetical protein